MRIMYITDVGFDSPNPNNHLINTMISAFLKENNTVYICQSHTTGTYNDIPENLKLMDGLNVDTISRASVKKSNFVMRYLTSIIYELKAERSWKKKINDIDIVILQSHYTAVYTAMLLKKYKKKIVLSIFDIFPGEAYSNGNIKIKFVYDFLSFIQKYLYRHCDKFFTLTTDTRCTLEKLGINREKITIIPNWFDDNTIHEVIFEENSFVKEFDMNKEFYYIQYAGSLGVSYDFDLIIDVAEILSYRSNIVFQIVGEGLKLEYIKKRIKSKGLSNFQFIKWQSTDRLSEVYSACTLQIVPLRKDVIRNSYPSKILPLMACKRVPVITVDIDSRFYKIVNDKRIGIATDIGDKKKIAESILYLIDNPEERKQMQENAYNYVYSNNTASLNTRKILNELNKMMEN